MTHEITPAEATADGAIPAEVTADDEVTPESIAQACSSSLMAEFSSEYEPPPVTQVVHVVTAESSCFA